MSPHPHLICSSTSADRLLKLRQTIDALKKNDAWSQKGREILFEELIQCHECMDVYWDFLSQDYEQYKTVDAPRLLYALNWFKQQDSISKDFEPVIVQVLSVPQCLRGNLELETLFLEQFVRYQHEHQIHYIPDMSSGHFLPMTLLLMMHQDENGRRWSRLAVRHIRKHGDPSQLTLDSSRLENMRLVWSDMLAWFKYHADGQSGASFPADGSLKGTFHLAKDPKKFFYGFLEVLLLIDSDAWAVVVKMDPWLISSVVELAGTQLETPLALHWYEAVRSMILAFDVTFWKHLPDIKIKAFCDAFLLRQDLFTTVPRDTVSEMFEAVASSKPPVPTDEFGISLCEKLVDLSGRLSINCKSSILTLISELCRLELKSNRPPSAWVYTFISNFYYCDVRISSEIQETIKLILDRDIQFIRSLFDTLKKDGYEKLDKQTEGMDPGICKPMWKSLVLDGIAPPLGFLRVILNSFTDIAVIDGDYVQKLKDDDSMYEEDHQILRFMVKSYITMTRALEHLLDCLLNPTLPEDFYRSTLFDVVHGGNEKTAAAVAVDDCLSGVLAMLVTPDRRFREAAETIFVNAGIGRRPEISQTLIELCPRNFLLALFQLIDRMFSSPCPDEWEMKLASRISMVLADCVFCKAFFKNVYKRMESSEASRLLHLTFAYGWQLFMAICQLRAARFWPEKVQGGLSAATLRSLSAAALLIKTFMESPLSYLLKGQTSIRTLSGIPFLVKLTKPEFWLKGLTALALDGEMADHTFLLLQSIITALSSLEVEINQEGMNVIRALYENESVLQKYRQQLFSALAGSRYSASFLALLPVSARQPPRPKSVSETSVPEQEHSKSTTPPTSRGLDLTNFFPEDAEFEKEEKQPVSKLAALRRDFATGLQPKTVHRLQPVSDSESDHEGENRRRRRSSITDLLDDCQFPVGSSPNVSRFPVLVGSSVTMSTKPARKTQVPRKTQFIGYNGLETSFKGTGVKQDNGTFHKSAVAPNIDRLHLAILGWDYWSIAEDDETLSVQKVPDSFQSIEDYESVFEPLLLCECRAQVIRNLEENYGEKVSRMKLKSASNVDDFLEVVFVSDEEGSVSISDNDLLLFSPWDDTKGDQIFEMAKQAAENQRPLILFGKVHNIISRARDAFQVAVRFNLKGKVNAIANMRQDARWACLNFDNLSTINREFKALRGLSHFELKQEILNPKHVRHPLPLATEESGSKTRSIAAAFRLNRPQAEAVNGVMRQKEGFVLIQGPPGTGKTKTILGIVGALLSEHGTLIMTPNLAKQFTNHILICAPSNAAVDELVRRIRRGLYTMQGQKSHPKIVRLGTVEGVHETVKDVSLDHLTDSRLLEDVQFAELIKLNVSNHLKTELATVKKDISEHRQLFHSEDVATSVENTFQKLNKEKTRIQDEIFKELSQKDGTRKLLESARQRLRSEILNGANVVLCTLSLSGHESLARDLDHAFDTVIIDEACQAIELSTVIPLKYGAKRCILVGDPNQLPPTVLSSKAAKFDYQQSLFVRLQKSRPPSSTHLLSIQYRMHPEISKFPNAIFYDSQLSDGEDMLSRNTQPWHQHPQNLFPPYCLFDIASGKEDMSKRGQSLYNVAEANAALQLYDKLCSEFPAIKFGGRVGIITPYKEQRRYLIRNFVNRYQRQILQSVEITTVDGFQGQERDIIILSCVRANPDSRSIGFLSDVRRLNVGLTRAKSSLWILGHGRSLMSNKYWRQLVEDAQNRKVYRVVELPIYQHKLGVPFPANAMEWPTAISQQPAVSQPLVVSQPSATPRPAVVSQHAAVPRPKSFSEVPADPMAKRPSSAEPVPVAPVKRTKIVFDVQAAEKPISSKSSSNSSSKSRSHKSPPQANNIKTNAVPIEQRLTRPGTTPAEPQKRIRQDDNASETSARSASSSSIQDRLSYGPSLSQQTHSRNSSQDSFKIQITNPLSERRDDPRERRDERGSDRSRHSSPARRSDPRSRDHERREPAPHQRREPAPHQRREPAPHQRREPVPNQRIGVRASSLYESRSNSREQSRERRSPPPSRPQRRSISPDRRSNGRRPIDDYGRNNGRRNHSPARHDNRPESRNADQSPQKHILWDDDKIIVRYTNPLFAPSDDDDRRSQ